MSLVSLLVRMWTLTCEDVENIPPRSQMKFLINFTFYKWYVLQRNVLRKFTSWLKRILQRGEANWRQTALSDRQQSFKPPYHLFNRVNLSYSEVQDRVMVCIYFAFSVVLTLELSLCLAKEALQERKDIEHKW